MNLHRLLPTLALPLLLAAPTLAQGRPGSIYRPDHGPIGMIADKTARRPGDLVTILIREQADVDNQETTNLLKETSLDYSLNTFDLKPNAFSVLPSIDAESEDNFTGTANYEKRGSFSARITAMVEDVLPNGNLVLSGRREIRVDNETKVIEFSGVVRRYDIDATNVVQSELVADARVSYIGEGVLTNSTNRTGVGRFLHSLISWIWPF